jgi:hypothetical protein
MKSVLSFPVRGNFGSPAYRGNCSGYVIKALLEHYTDARAKTLFCDPMVGGKTSEHVARKLNSEGRQIEFVGLDLRDGFNLLKDELRDQLPREADFIFAHPPYASIIPYSGPNGMWGCDRAAHPDDLSNCANYEEFLAKLQIALNNCYRGLRRGGHYSLLIGDVRKNGDYFCLAADIRQLAPGVLKDVLVKTQHNCVSDSRSYSGKFIQIAHEFVLSFAKEGFVFGMIDTALATSQRLQMLSNANWRALTEGALRQLGGKASLQEIYEIIEKSATKKTEGRPNWTAKVRQILHLHALNVERGVWALKAA